jgi:hypothetical protein
MYKALLTAAMGIALSPLLAATTTTGPAWSNSEGALQLDPPAAPSNCSARSTTYPFDFDYYTVTTVTWRDNSTNEDGFTVEVWRNQPGGWVLVESRSTAANSTAVSFSFLGRHGPNVRFRVKAFNASGTPLGATGRISQ